MLQVTSTFLKPGFLTAHNAAVNYPNNTPHTPLSLTPKLGMFCGIMNQVQGNWPCNCSSPLTTTLTITISRYTRVSEYSVTLIECRVIMFMRILCYRAQACCTALLHLSFMQFLKIIYQQYIASGFYSRFSL